MPKSDKAEAKVAEKSAVRSPLKIAALVALTLPVLAVAIYFVGMLKTAEAREISAACGSLAPTPASKTISAIPTTANEFSLERLDLAAFDALKATGQEASYQGKMVSLSDYRGKVVLVNFWASWCKTCRAEKPSLESMAKDYAGDDVEVLAIASDPDWQKVRGALPRTTKLTVLLDKAEKGFGPITEGYGISAFPETFVIDKKGNIRYYLVNKRDWRSSVARTCIEALTRE